MQAVELMAMVRSISAYLSNNLFIIQNFGQKVILRLLIGLWFKVIKLPCALLLKLYFIGLVAIDTAIIEVETLDFIYRLDKWHKLNRAADDAALLIGVSLRG